MNLRDEIHLEALRAGERRRAAYSLGNCALADIETHHSPRPSPIHHRDPCTFCGVRGDIGCEHQEPMLIEALRDFERYPPRRRAG